MTDGLPAMVRFEDEGPATAPAPGLKVVAGAARVGRWFWTTREEKILREHYPKGGPEACLPRLPGRSRMALYNHASKLGLRGPRQHDFRRQRWTSSGAIDAVIRRAYQAAPTGGAINDLARRVGRPRWWVSRRAVVLGLVVPRFKQPDWSAAEIELLDMHGHKRPQVVARILHRHGFARSATAVVVKMKRLGVDRIDPARFTATQLAGLFGVNVKTVTRWIDLGWLKAKRRGTARTPQQGGDQWWIHRRDIRAFVIDNAAAVDLRRVDRFWFIDLLAGG